MLQLNSYMNRRYLRWFFINLKKEMIPFKFLLVRKNKEKKRLVFTARIKRLYFTIFILLMLQAGFLQYLLRGDYNLEHIIIFFASLIILANLKIFYVLVSNTINIPFEKLIARYYIKSAKKIIKSHKNLLVIGITGSYGKTSTKYILNKMLSERFNVLMTPESYNTTMGVVRTIRESLKVSHQIFIAEMGAKEKGDIKEICDLVSPKHGIITSIGPQHLETFKTIETIIDTKFELAEALEHDGIAFLNFDNTYIRQRNFQGNFVKYTTSFNENLGIKYWSENIKYDSQGLSFEFCGKEKNQISLKTKLLGRHNVLNIVAAAAVATELGVLPHQIQYAVKRLNPVPHRLELKSMQGGTIVIDDAYNSNPEGANEAINVLNSFKDYKKILITPGLIELGEKEDECNFSLGKKAGECADYIILIGENNTIHLKKGVKEVCKNDDKVFVAKNLQEGLKRLEDVRDEKSVVLFLNDLPDNY